MIVQIATSFSDTKPLFDILIITTVVLELNFRVYPVISRPKNAKYQLAGWATSGISLFQTKHAIISCQATRSFLYKTNKLPSLSMAFIPRFFSLDMQIKYSSLLHNTERLGVWYDVMKRSEKKTGRHPYIHAT